MKYSACSPNPVNQTTLIPLPSVIVIQQAMKRPVALVCYICGREFGTKSLAIHLKACEKKWENEQNLLPPKQRRPCPRPPKGFEEMSAKGQITKEDMNKFNAQSYDAFVEEALVECQYCGRRFNEKSLVPHQKACMKSPMIRKPFLNKGPMGKFAQQEQPIATHAKYQMPPEDVGPQGNLVPCRRCGRKFNADRVGKHEKVCQGERVQVGLKREEEKPMMKPMMKPQQLGKEKKAKWKIQHQELQNAMKMMRQMRAIEAKGGKISNLPPPPPSNYDHYVQCRHCGRKYAADVAERHIPKCANIINKPGGIKPSKIQEKYIAGTGSGGKNWGGSDQWGGNSAINGSKPNMVVSKPTNPSSYVKPPSNNNPFDPYGSKNGGYYGSSQQTGPGPKSFVKGSTFEQAPASKAGGMGKGGFVSMKEEKVNYLKPNLHAKSNPSNYW